LATDRKNGITLNILGAISGEYGLDHLSPILFMRVHHKNPGSDFARHVFRRKNTGACRHWIVLFVDCPENMRDVVCGSNREVWAGNREVGFALTNGHRQTGCSSPTWAEIFT
jgi:hypothetical protein